MPSGYRYILDCVVVENLLRLPLRERDFSVTVFRRLEGDPYQKGESNFHDPSGREIQRKQFSAWVVLFWSDHAVKEVRIVGVQRLRRPGKTP